MSELILLPVKPCSLAEEDLQALRAAGVTVIYHEEPETLRLIRTVCDDIPSGLMLACAMRALLSGTSSGADAQRLVFAQKLARAVIDKHDANGGDK